MTNEHNTPPAAAPAPAEPFGYFRVDALGWTDCAATDEGAIALYERPAAPAVPQGWRFEKDYGSITVFTPSGGSCVLWECGHGGVETLAYQMACMLAATSAAPSQEPAVPQGWKLVPIEPTPEMGRAYLEAAKIHAAEGAEDKMRFSPGGYAAMLSATPAAPSQPAVPQGIPAHEVIDAIEAWKSAWAKVPPFGNKVNKATREAITFSHNTLFQLLWSAQREKGKA